MKTAALNLLRYQEDGTLWWCEEAYHNCRHKLAGSLSGTGYWYIEHRNKQHRRSRLVWEIHHGPIPVDKVVDHINGMRTDDRIENLQLVSQAENILLGTPRLHKRNTHGYTGVYFIPGRRVGKQYQASVRYKGKNISFGYHATPEDAAEARRIGMEELGLISRR
ncbi:putative endonuclease [Pectobacterium phage Zenivior_B1]|uniref:Putative endonuclease n=2 Tax=Phimunavirus zenivior TaxID=2733345 RepID=A0A3G8FJV4_9CAUD|nr:HNH endonuclease [Pectobacterium phage Zenivior]AZF94990.1 putative endonuclease [Pectobacterium phage Zenivior]AZF95051.1 putative endonuclease [Pectobacterium phage Zenivior_B1]